MVFRGEGCIAGETQAGFSCGFSPFPSHMVLYRCHTSPSFVRFCIEIVMKINTDTQPLDPKWMQQVKIYLQAEKMWLSLPFVFMAFYFIFIFFLV